MEINVSRVASLVGDLRSASNKSITHRALILAAMARPGSKSVVRNPLRADDTQATATILSQLGATIEIEPGRVLITAPPGFNSPEQNLDCGNSGTTMRLLAGVLASTPGLEATLVGDESLSKRPMKRIVEPLRSMGAQIEGDTAPLKISGRELHGIDYESPVASAQVKTCLLLAGVKSVGTIRLREPHLSRDHTERMLTSLGVKMECKGATVVMAGGQSWGGFDINVPVDISSAAFFLCAAAMVGGARVTLRDVGVNPTRSGVLDALTAAGATVRETARRDEGGEPVADLLVEGGSPLHAFDVSGALVPRLIDEIPVLAVLATQCDGVTTFRDASELRVKETDRVETVATGLRDMGAQVETFDDGLAVHGPVQLHGATIDAKNDHRIAMAFAVAGLVADSPTKITNAESVRSSYPDFERDLTSIAVY